MQRHGPRQGRGTKMTRRGYSVTRLLSLLLVLSVMACSVPVRNIAPSESLEGKKVLGGRFVFYDNDAPKNDSSFDFKVVFNREGDTQARVLEPDADGYVYVAVVPGRYNFGTVMVHNPFLGNFNFRPDPVPSVTVVDSDSAVNFGTFNVRFYQGAGAKTAAMLIGVTSGTLKIEWVNDFDTTRAALATRVGRADMKFGDGRVEFRKRAK